eukprot:448596-Pyramimonas_sp.AAC.1
MILRAGGRTELVAGNKDLPAGVRALNAAVKAGRMLSHLPQPYRGFYECQAIKALQTAVAKQKK